MPLILQLTSVCAYLQYSGKEVDNLEAKVDQNVLRLVDLLDTKYISVDKPFDFGRKAQYFTLDVISDLAFGAPFGDVETDSDVHGYVTTMESSMPTIIVTTVLPWVIKMMQSPIFKSMIPSETDSIGLGKTMAYVFSIRPCFLCFLPL